MRHQPGRVAPHLLDQGGSGLHRRHQVVFCQVGDLAALAANQVDMGAGVGVVARRSVAGLSSAAAGRARRTQVEPTTAAVCNGLRARQALNRRGRQVSHGRAGVPVHDQLDRGPACHGGDVNHPDEGGPLPVAGQKIGQGVG